MERAKTCQNSLRPSPIIHRPVTAKSPQESNRLLLPSNLIQVLLANSNQKRILGNSSQCDQVDRVHFRAPCLTTRSKQPPDHPINHPVEFSLWHSLLVTGVEFADCGISHQTLSSGEQESCLSRCPLHIQCLEMGVSGTWC